MLMINLTRPRINWDRNLNEATGLACGHGCVDDVLIKLKMWEESAHSRQHHSIIPELYEIEKQSRAQEIKQASKKRACTYFLLFLTVGMM